MKGEGCGGHGEDDAGVWNRDDACDWCQRHDWFIHESAAQEDLAKAMCGRWDGPHKDVDYDTMKSHWRTAGSVIGDMLALGWTIVRAPTACDQCGSPANDEIHQDITLSGGRPKNVYQHPFEETT